MKVDTTVINDKGTREALGKQVLLSVEDMDITYGKGAAAIRGISFTISPGEVLAIVGESGSGKTSIIRALLGCISGDGQIAKGNVFGKICRRIMTNGLAPLSRAAVT